MNTSAKLSRRSALVGLSLAAAPATVASACALSEADPVFAVIAEHRAAQEALDAAGKVPETEYDESIYDRADRRAIDAEHPLFTTEPTTIAGVAALLEYVGSDLHPCLGTDSEDGTTILSYAHGWENRPDVVEAARTFPRRMGTILRNLIAQEERHASLSR
jgi:hypothetical protein